MGQVPSVAEIKAQNRVARLEDSQHNRSVGLGPGMGLDVGPTCSKKLAEPVDGYLLDLVNNFATSVISFSGQAFRVFIGQNGTGRLHDLIGDIIFGSDQFQADALAFFFGLDKVRQEGVVHRGR